MAVLGCRFIRGAGFESAGVAWWTNSSLSHFEYRWKGGGWIGAHPDGGIQPRPMNYCKVELELYYELECSDSNLDEFYEWAGKDIGIKYDLTDIAGLLFHDHKLHRSGMEICSEWGFQGLNLPFWPWSKPILNVLPDRSYLVTPDMLHLAPVFIGRLKHRAQ